jgi:membrane protein required for colicin V production
VLLDLIVLAVLALAALHGAMGGALRQVVQLGAAVLGWLAARHLGPPVAAGFGRWFPGIVARPAASMLLFVGTYALATLVAAALLRGTRLSSVVGGPTDRGVGGVLGGLKGALIAWVLLSALALGGGRAPAWLGGTLRGSDFASLATRHNLLIRIDPDRAHQLERILAAAREAERTGATTGDGAEARALLADPRMRALAESGGTPDPAEVERALQDPRVRALVDKIRERAEAVDRAVP